MEPIEDTDDESCEYCGFVGTVRQFRRPGKRMMDSVCPRCGFSKEEYYVYLSEKTLRAKAAAPDAPSYLKFRTPEITQERFIHFSRIEERIRARREAAARRGSGSCLLLLLGIPAGVLAIYSFVG